MPAHLATAASMRSAVVREQKVVHAVLSFLAGVPVVGGQLSESLFLRKLKLHEVVTGVEAVEVLGRS